MNEKWALNTVGGNSQKLSISTRIASLRDVTQFYIIDTLLQRAFLQRPVETLARIERLEANGLLAGLFLEAVADYGMEERIEHAIQKCECVTDGLDGVDELATVGELVIKLKTEINRVYW